MSVKALIDDDRRHARPPRRRGEQRGRIALRARRRAVGEVQHQDHRAQPAWAALGLAPTPTRRMQSQERGGSIVNVASVSGRRPTPGTAAYGAAKAGVESITSTLAVEWAPKVRVNSVVVGHGGDRAVRTVLRRRGFHRGDLAQRPAGSARQTGRRRLGRRRSWPPTRRPTSAVRRSKCTAAASPRTTWPPPPLTSNSSQGRQRIWDCLTAAWSS